MNETPELPDSVVQEIQPRTRRVLRVLGDEALRITAIVGGSAAAYGLLRSGQLDMLPVANGTFHSVASASIVSGGLAGAAAHSFYKKRKNTNR